MYARKNKLGNANFEKTVSVLWMLETVKTKKRSQCERTYNEVKPYQCFECWKSVYCKRSWLCMREPSWEQTVPTTSSGPVVGWGGFNSYPKQFKILQMSVRGKALSWPIQVIKKMNEQFCPRLNCVISSVGKFELQSKTWYGWGRQSICPDIRIAATKLILHDGE